MHGHMEKLMAWLMGDNKKIMINADKEVEKQLAKYGIEIVDLD